MKQILLALFLIGALVSTQAEIRVAATLTPEAVWDAFDAAKDGDTVQLPEGTAVWKHGWNTHHGAKMKAITIQGAGMDKTIIRTDTTRDPGDKAFELNGVEGKPFRITGITFDGTGFTNAGTWIGEVVIRGSCKNFRIDHCKIMNMDHMIMIDGDTVGLIDHCCFYPWQKKNLAQTIYVQGPGKIAFSRPLTLGTSNAVYFEDNDAHFSPEVVNGDGNNPWIVPYSGARLVVRHNKIINTQLEIYRVRPGCYGNQSTEIYDNTFSAVGLNNYRPQGFIFVGGGTVIIFNNTVTGTTYNTKTLSVSHDRAFMSIGEFGICDGNNPLDGNQIPAGQVGAGYPGFGEPGWGTDPKATGVFKPSPCYAWSNTLNGAPLKMELRPWGDPVKDAKQGAHVKEGREFFNEEPKPEYYKPYVYPHPLQSESAWEALMTSAAASANGTKASAGNP